jgi:hypothetical protein
MAEARTHKPSSTSLTRVYTVRTANGDRDWHADNARHAREQHDEAFGGEPGETIERVFTLHPNPQPSSGR